MNVFNSYFTLVILSFLVGSTIHATTISLATYNLRNYNNTTIWRPAKDEKLLKKIIKQTGANLIVFQEIINENKFSKFIFNNFKTYNHFTTTCGGKGKQKISIIYDTNKLTASSIYEWKKVTYSNCESRYRPYLIAPITVKNNPTFFFTVIGAHLKAGGRRYDRNIRQKQFNDLTYIIKQLIQSGNKNIFLMGDLNTTGIIEHHESPLFPFLLNNNLYSFGNEINCSSYWRGDTNNNQRYPSLLDHIIIRNDLFKQITNYKLQITVSKFNLIAKMYHVR